MAAAAASGNERPTDVGILAMEVYFPRTFVAQRDLEVYDGVPAGKYTIGLGQDEMSFTGDREDVNSIALTVVAQLLEKYGIAPEEIGRLEVGTETLVDKSKSTKTVLMQLFEPSGNTNIEGVTTVNACYGGTAALLNALAWVESSAWDGRFALVVAADIAVYAKGPARPTSGCGGIAMLIGPNAPLVVDSRTRATHASHIWDFYKPDPSVEFPTVDGRQSQACYLRALDDCYLRFCEKNERVPGTNKSFNITSLDYALFHSPYNKLVQKSFARLFFLDSKRQRTSMDAASPLSKWHDIPIEDTYADRELDLTTRRLADELYKAMVEPCHAASKKVGNCYTASVYFNLAALVSCKASDLDNKRTAVFSYGSGSMASMFSVTGRTATTDKRFSLERMADVLDVQQRLKERTQSTAEEFAQYMDLREAFHAKKSTAPVQPVSTIADGAFYLVDINEKYQRSYARKTSELTVEEPKADSGRHGESSNGSLYVSGVSALLPSVDSSEPGRDLNRNLDMLLEGKNCINQLGVDSVQAILSRNIVQRPKGPMCQGKRIVNRDECIQVAASIRLIDLSALYDLPPNMVDGMDDATRLGVAAGLDALQDAGLVDPTSGNWRLADDVGKTMGIVYATSYPTMNETTREVSRFHAHRTENDPYELDRKFLFRVLILANAQVAQLTGARGPNTQINAACAGMTQAIGLAQDWIALGRCKRVLVISSDVAGNTNLLPWIGGGFRLLGAATIASTVKEAALPFDARRSGMLVGSGAAGIVLEAPEVVPAHCPTQRQVRLLLTRYANSAYHGASIDTKHVTEELRSLFAEVEVKFGITRRDFAESGVYYSHETFTNSSPTASCAFAEVSALRGALGDELLAKLLIANTRALRVIPWR